MLDSIKMINEEGTSTPYGLVGGACSVISTTNNGNGNYTLNLPDGTELEESKIYYVKFSPTSISHFFSVRVNEKGVYSMTYGVSKILKSTKMYYKNTEAQCFGTTNPVLPLMYTTNGFYVVGEHIIAGYYNYTSSEYNDSLKFTYKKYNVYTSGRADYFNCIYSPGAVIISAPYLSSSYYSLTFKDPPHVEISCWGKDENNIPRMVLKNSPKESYYTYKVLDHDVYGYSIKVEGIVF